MSKTIISEGKTSVEAIEKGLKKLKVSKESVDIKIVEEKKKKSFFNILDPHVVKVELTIKKDEINSASQGKKEENNQHKQHEQKEHKVTVTEEEIMSCKEEIEKFLSEFTSKIGNDITTEVHIENDNIFVNVLGQNSAKLIGYRGEALNALQIVLTSIAGKKSEHPIKVLLDIEDYREKRKKTLEELAKKIERTVNKTGKKVTLEPMVAYERKIIHTALQESLTVKTYSIGEESNRRVVVVKK